MSNSAERTSNTTFSWRLLPAEFDDGANFAGSDSDLLGDAVEYLALCVGAFDEWVGVAVLAHGPPSFDEWSVGVVPAGELLDVADAVECCESLVEFAADLGIGAKLGLHTCNSNFHPRNLECV